jgi:hypothetical protein
MLRLNLTNNAMTQQSLQPLIQKSALTLFARSLISALPLSLLLTVLASHTASANTANESKPYRSLSTSSLQLQDTADSHYLTSQMTLLQFSTIFINKSGKPAVELPRRKLSTQTEAYNRSIELLVSTGEFVTPRATINLLNPNANHGYSQDSTEPYRSGGSALGEVFRMGLKSWWDNNEGSQLHAMSQAAPESVRTGKVAGKARFDWDYSLKVSYDDVKLKFEKAF